MVGWIAFCCCKNCFLDADILCTWIHLAYMSSRGIVCSKEIVREQIYLNSETLMEFAVCATHRMLDE